MLAGANEIAQIWRAAGTHPQPTGLLVAALRLCLGDVPFDLATAGTTPGLDLAALLAPLLAWATLAIAAWRIGGNRVRRGLIGWQGEHLIIAGASDFARQTLSSERRSGRRVVLFYPHVRPPWVRQAGRRGAAIARRIGQTGLGRARGLIVADDDPDQSMAVVAAVDHAIRSAPLERGPLDVTVLTDDLAKVAPSVAQLSGRVRHRLLSWPQLAARDLLLRAPLGRFERAAQADRPVLVVGFTPVLEAYLARALIACQPRDGIKPRFIVAVADAVGHEATFHRRHHAIDWLSPVRFREWPRERDAARAILADLVAPPIQIVADLADDAGTLQWADQARAWFRERAIVSPPFCLHLRAPADALPPADIVFGSASLPGLGSGSGDDDRLPRALHQFYLEGRLVEGEILGSRASLHDWDDLPEQFREDNRLAADCYLLKLRDISARVVSGRGSSLQLTQPELEDLSRAEHDRWMVAKLGSGWSYGVNRDDARRLHPDIVPYDQLSEATRDLDREQVRVMTRLLANAGQRALRTLTILIDGQAGPLGPLGPLLAEVRRHYPDRSVVLAASGDDRQGCERLAATPLSGWSVMLALTRDPHDAESAACALLAEADHVVAVPEGLEPSVVLRERADLVVVGHAGEGPPGAIVLSGDGRIESAPWRS